MGAFFCGQVGREEGPKALSPADFPAAAAAETPNQISKPLSGQGGPPTTGRVGSGPGQTQAGAAAGPCGWADEMARAGADELAHPLALVDAPAGDQQPGPLLGTPKKGGPTATPSGWPPPRRTIAGGGAPVISILSR